MLAELAAFNAAYGVVKEFIGNGRDLADCFGPIGQMVGAKEDLKLRQEKNKKSLFAMTPKSLWLWSRSRKQKKNSKTSWFTLAELDFGTTLLSFRLRLASQD